MGIYVAVVALSLPGGLVLTLVGGFLFGWIIGGTATVIAATLGAVLVFEIVRTSLGEFLARKAGPWLSKLSDGFRKDAFHYMLFLRLVPVFPFWLINIAPALLNVKRSDYIITTLLGILPATYAFASLGAGLDSVIVKQRSIYEACVAAKGAANCTFSIDPRALVTGQMLFAFAALSLVALIPLIAKRLKGRINGGCQEELKDG
ncbi:MAG TPA: TVP38/TMEM64 family protein [Rhizobiales bacterium]|nr:TVP38/TMEM64 family protein [Hyphomicrobiales bacterium]